jgi:hypothetical protein
MYRVRLFILLHPHSERFLPLFVSVRFLTYTLIQIISVPFGVCSYFRSHRHIERRSVSLFLTACESSHPIPQCCTLRNQFRPRNQFRAIPGNRSSHNIKGLHAINRVLSIPCNSGIRLNSQNSGIGRNSQEFHVIPCNSGITRNSQEFRKIPSNSV